MDKWQEYFPYWDLPAKIAPQLVSVLQERPRDDQELKFAMAVEALPKIELHVHLEAAVPASYYARLNEIKKLFAPGDLPSERAPFLDFKDFIRAWIDHTRLIDHEDDLEAMASAFVDLRSKHNIVYTEAHISPFDFTLGRRRLNINPVLDFSRALRAYLRGVRSGIIRHPEIEVRLIVDLLWISDLGECEQMMEAIAQIMADASLRCPLRGNPLIVALGLGGFEAVGFSAQKRGLLDRYAHLGLKLDIHCGETTTASEYQTSVSILRPDRIGHGIAPLARPEPGILAFNRGISLCPSSNILTGAFKGPLSLHPFGTLLHKGLPISINTDDPLLFGTTLTLEFVMLRQAFGLELADVRTLLKNALNMAFDQAAARRFLSGLDSEPDHGT